MKCRDCDKETKLKPCQVHNPADAMICKDCCIKRNGHDCEWWHMCYGV